MKICLRPWLPSFPALLLSLGLVYTSSTSFLLSPTPTPFNGESDDPGVSQLPPAPTVSCKLLKMRLPPGRGGGGCGREGGVRRPEHSWWAAAAAPGLFGRSAADYYGNQAPAARLVAVAREREREAREAHLRAAGPETLSRRPGEIGVGAQPPLRSPHRPDLSEPGSQGERRQG